ncbi:biotin-dependent enzyme [Tepidamorphus gemmatus]|uniref:Biotin carboxyl carrier protein of acetyl-CoA carboxylase n=1 Tax=Tepidamorphus gemmatus TaxID=747076 RepID=A0A4R3MCY0_9HYPH|nr:acetyl-CoA carboxylase [Tepidamorphus gemmatus]TCT09887.1 biotin-dependent enzyme [Tepidamorphus gemmatus]
MSEKHILSPLPGTFYRKPAPDKPPFKDVGDMVTLGEVVGLVEVMKTFYEVKSELEGKVARILAENEAAVQAGEPLIELE